MGVRNGARVSEKMEQSLLVLAALLRVVGTVVGCAIRERGGIKASE